MDMQHKQIGLTSDAVAKRVEEGKVNRKTDPPTKTVGQIVFSHIFTLFNLINLALAVLLLAVGSYRNLLFMGVVISNTVIGIFQEMRAKKTMDRLSLLAAPHVAVLRDGAHTNVAVEELVLDDAMCLENGNQIAADAIVAEGEIEVNEALLTGEADAIAKRPGDHLRSGSFVVSGSCVATVEHVGADNYVAQLTEKAKRMEKPHSMLMQAIGLIVKIVGVIILPIGILMFCKQYFSLDRTFAESVVSMASSAIGMIPEGLVLLTSISLAVGIIKLAMHKTLVQEMYSIESLARVDVLCLDKTGTITEGCMKVEEIVPLRDTPYSPEEVLAALARACDDHNPTADALRARFAQPPDWSATEIVPFSSARKYSAAAFARQGTFALGAPQMLLPDRGEALRSRIEPYTGLGKRVLLLCGVQRIGADKSVSGCEPLALVVLSDKVREDAAETLAYFAQQGVTLKVISGDHHRTVASVAAEAGLAGAERSIDLDGLSDQEVTAACEDYTVFGRVSPQQKCLLIDALKARGHVVAMTGDGVNDVLALKNADCSIAMAAGSDAARHVSQLVLLDSNFASLPKVVAEGRRVINNTRRAASLYLVKTVYSTLLALLFLFLDLSYPFAPIQMTLIGALTVGIPSFFLALEPNNERVPRDFMGYVLSHTVPGALTIVLAVLGVMFVSEFTAVSHAELSTMSAFATGFVSFLILYGVCQPFDAKRIALFSVMFAAFVLCVICFGGLFLYVPLSPLLLLLLIGVCVLSIPTLALLAKGVLALYRRLKKD